MTLDKKLAHLRKKAGLSQTEVSEELDVSRQAVTKWETGLSRPSTENLHSLSKLYNVPLEYLLDDTAEILNSVQTAGAKDNQFWGTDEREKSSNTKKKFWIIGTCVVLILLILVAMIHARGEKRNTPVGDMAVDEEDQYPVVGFSIDW